MAPALRYAAGPEKLKPKSIISETSANISSAYSKLAKLQAERAQTYGWLDALTEKMSAQVLRSQQKLARFGAGSLAASLSTTPVTRYQQEELRYKAQLATLQQRIDDLSAYIKSEDVKLAIAKEKEGTSPPTHARNRSNNLPPLRIGNLDTESYGNSLMAADNALFEGFMAHKKPGIKPMPTQNQSPVPQ